MSANTLTLAFVGDGWNCEEPTIVRQAVIAGWTGRDPVAVEAHIRELEALGVRRPSSTPVFYRVSASRLTMRDAIETVGTASSGEVELLLLGHGGRLWVGVGSDHTDRALEIHDVAMSKQVCDKPIARSFWLYEEVAHHWDSLVLRSFVMENGERVLYQQGTAQTMLTPGELIERYCGAGKLEEGTLMFCGTLTARGGVRPAERFELELEDPVLARSIQHAYSVVALPASR